MMMEKAGCLMSNRWLEWAKRIQALSQAGIEYSKDVYDLERFEELRKISGEIMMEYTNTKQFQTIEQLFLNEQGYQTPKVDVRGVVFQDGQILLVKEVHDGLWSLPGGWADIGLTPSENVVKEIREESGLEARAKNIIAVWNRSSHPHPPSPYEIYKIFIDCEAIGGHIHNGVETSAVGFFSEDDLPPLSTGRITESQIRTLFAYHRGEMTHVLFD
jgi:ADP-ribose pyrophosphatase YjhB (NUDIX family)